MGLGQYDSLGEYFGHHTASSVYLISKCATFSDLNRFVCVMYYIIDDKLATL